jgi:hypothetical protein
MNNFTTLSNSPASSINSTYSQIYKFANVNTVKHTPLTLSKDILPISKHNANSAIQSINLIWDILF